MLARSTSICSVSLGEVSKLSDVIITVHEPLKAGTVTVVIQNDFKDCRSLRCLTQFMLGRAMKHKVLFFFVLIKERLPQPLGAVYLECK